jgi:UDP-N-acetylglucosamine 2-epimerase (non-hydrolysing)
MIDSFEMLREKIYSAGTQADLNLEKGRYALVTLHRPSNVDSVETLAPIVDELISVAADMPVVFVAHPRTINGLERFELRDKLSDTSNVMLLEPLPYVQFMNVVTGARLVITDSGGLQEETTYLGIPCLTLRDTTERPITVSLGTNKLVDVANLGDNLRDVQDGNWPAGDVPPLWDGNTASRAVESLYRRSNGRQSD